MKNVIVLTTESEKKSAAKLGYPTYTFLPLSQAKDNIVIRWGNGYVQAPVENLIFSPTDDFECVLNKQESIELNVNKPKALGIISQTVTTPKIYLGKVPSKKTVVFRPTTHASGSGFALRKAFEIPAGHYATEFIKTNKEVRVFVCGSRTTICTRRKAKKSDSDICRSNYAYDNFRKTPKNLHKMSLRAAKALNLDLCAFDILVKGRKYYFLEANTAPTIEGAVRKFYQSGIKNLIEKRFYKNHTETKKSKPSFISSMLKKMGIL